MPCCPQTWDNRRYMFRKEGREGGERGRKKGREKRGKEKKISPFKCGKIAHT